jgi:hypothetical protein
MGSSKKHGRKILGRGIVSKEEAERLLLDWANLSDQRMDESAAWLFRRHQRALKALEWKGDPEQPLNPYEIYTLRLHLRKAWNEPDPRTREWHIFQLRRKFSEWSLSLSASSESDLISKPMIWFEQVPPLTPLEATMCYFQEIGNLAKYCGNPDCPAPYFIAVKRWGKYCSEKCSGPGERESKRNWWRKNRGKEGSQQ